MEQSTNSGLDLRQAEHVGRQFNLAFTNTIGYGPSHPICQKSYHAIVKAVHGAGADRSELTLILDRDAFFIDQHMVNRTFNAKRLIAAFKRLELQSVTIQLGVKAGDIERLMVVLSDGQVCESLDAARRDLSDHGIDGILLNYVTFRKVTADEEVISRDGLEDLAARATLDTAGAAPPASPATQSESVDQHSSSMSKHFVALEDDVLSRISAVFSLREMFEHPDTMADSLCKASAGMSDDAKRTVVSQLRHLTDEVERGASSDSSPISLDQMMEAVCRLRRDLNEGITAQKATGRFFASEGAVVSEVDQLTYRTIVSLVRQEYRGANLTVKRLAQIIRKMLPDERDLKRLLPQLKEALLAEGMPVSEYLQLVTELSDELRSEGLVQALSQGAEEVGLSVDEIAEEIRENPGEAARLVVLAAELRRGGQSDENLLSTMVAEYIERVSGKMALQAPEAGTREGGKALRTVIYRLERELIDRLKAQGLASTVLAQVESRLSGHFQELVNHTKSEWIMALLSRAGELTGTHLVESLGTVIEHQGDLESLGDPLRQVLLRQGYTEEKVQEVYAKLSAHVEQHAQMYLLPRSVLSAKNTTYFLQRHIKSVDRYGTPFACVLVTLVAAMQNGEWRELSAREAADLMPEVFRLLTANVRDLDFVGTFGSLERTMPFLILPMAKEAGAEAVRQRLYDVFETNSVLLDGAPVQLRMAVSATGYDKERTPDVKSAVGLVLELHAAEERARKLV